jgi:hypothetical protein
MKYEKIVYSVKFLSFSLSLINIVDFDLEIIQVYVTSRSARIILFNFFFKTSICTLKRSHDSTE